MLKNSARKKKLEKISKNLQSVYDHFWKKDCPKYMHYHRQEDILKFLSKKLKNQKRHSRQLLNKIIDFVCCLDAFYSSGLRYGNSQSDNQIYQISIFIFNHWSEGLNFRKRLNSKKIFPCYVEDFRDNIVKLGYNNYYSFITKFYHQFNQKYSICDRMVKNFCKIFSENYCQRKLNSEIYCDFHNFVVELGSTLTWRRELNEFDKAIWILMKEICDKKKKKPEKITINEIINYKL